MFTVFISTKIGTAITLVLMLIYENTSPNCQTHPGFSEYASYQETGLPMPLKSRLLKNQEIGMAKLTLPN
jgi:hypothetical protein